MQEFHAVPPQPAPVVVTIDSGTRERRTPRFLNLLVRVHRGWRQGPAEEPVHYRLAS